MQKFKSSVELDLVASPALGEVADQTAQVAQGVGVVGGVGVGVDVGR